MNKIKFKTLTPGAVIPCRATEESAGMDLVPVETSYCDGQLKCRFGFAMELPKGYAAFIFPRSSIKNYPFMLSNCVGVIDSDYRGEVMAYFNHIELQKLDNTWKHGDRIFYQANVPVAQMIVMPIPEFEFEVVDELSDTERGTGGYGSTTK